ncbi:MAG: hypothetical protein ACFFBV_08835 [Promethearchaeota archaeon]
MTTPSAPLPNARIIKSDPTRPVHGTKTILIESGYCARMVPAISAEPYPHFQQAYTIILISLSSPILLTSLLLNW